MTPEIQTFAAGSTWAAACAERLTDALSDAVAANGRATFAGSGGSTPAPIYRLMSETDLDWTAVAVTLVDERNVPETDEQSNARLLKQTLLADRAAVARYVPLYHPAVTVDRAAAMATVALRPEGRLDAVLLGMGEDGHICSMFPDSPTLKTLLSPDLNPAVLGVPAGREGRPPSLERLSINLPYLIQAGRVVLALTGTRKRAVFEEQAAGDPAVTPIAALIAHKVPLEVLWTETAP
ncbi:MAG: 6-phosphogluconolactonase [Caulobacterales bacterium]|nr:6-phosphogluconolactonase [Caulobacterales bacterium]